MAPELDADWPGASAERLRALQSSCAHLPADRRREYLREELRALAAALPAGEQAGALEALAARFPADSGAPVPAAADEPAPDLLLEQVRSRLAGLDPADRQAFAASLREICDGAPGPARPPALPGLNLHGLLRCEAEQLPHLQLAITVLKSGKLEIGSPGALELLNLVKTAALLIDTFAGIEGVFWKIWSAAAPKSAAHDPFAGGFLAETARLLEGTPGSSFASYSRAVTHSGQLLVAMLSAIPTALDRLAGSWLDQFAPERIAADVRRTERGPLGGSPEQRFWREYEYRCADFTPQRLVETFFRHLAESTGTLTAST
jgi:hypothetical protein